MRHSILIILFFIGLQAYAQKEDSVVLGNASLHYFIYGSGEPILILSGGPGLSSHQEDDLALNLSKNYQSILFDQRGTGKSWTTPMDSSTINLQTAINDIEVLRKHLKINQLVICGHSWGAMLASAYAEKYPKQVKSLILIGGGELDITLSSIVDENVSHQLQLSDTTAWDYWSDSTVIKKDSQKAEYEIRKLRWLLISYDRNKIDDILKQAAHGVYNIKMGNLMWESLRKEKFNLINGLATKYKGKTLVVFGWQDPIALTTLHQYQRAYPNALIKGINQCGHMPSVEQPKEYFESINSFLKQN